MKRFYMYILFALILPTLGYAQFTGFNDETGLSVPMYSVDNTFIGNNGDVISNDASKYTNDANITTSAEVNINVAGSNRICSIGRKTFASYVDYVGCIVRVSILPFIFTLALLAFIWGVTVMIRHPDNQESQKEGRIFILWGIIGFFVITSVYALVAIIRRTVGFGSNFKDDATPYVQLKEKVQKLK